MDGERFDRGVALREAPLRMTGLVKGDSFRVVWGRRRRFPSGMTNKRG